ncbi:hypothetical protein IAU60_002198 [Kwoniella sp. DSM 27419]
MPATRSRSYGSAARLAAARISRSGVKDKHKAEPIDPDDDHDSPDQLDRSAYRATKNEVGVFTTPGYSDAIKPLWRFKDATEAAKSAEAIWGRFEGYRDQRDFIGMDICRKFIQMGRTRSLRYALRPGGRKYDPSTGKERQRTGQVYDQGKLDGAGVYEAWLARCWDDEAYKELWDEWRDGARPSPLASAGSVEVYEREEKKAGEGVGEFDAVKRAHNGSESSDSSTSAELRVKGERRRSSDGEKPGGKAGTKNTKNTKKNGQRHDDRVKAEGPGTSGD